MLCVKQNEARDLGYSEESREKALQRTKEGGLRRDRLNVCDRDASGSDYRLMHMAPPMTARERTVNHMWGTSFVFDDRIVPPRELLCIQYLVLLGRGAEMFQTVLKP